MHRTVCGYAVKMHSAVVLKENNICSEEHRILTPRTNWYASSPNLNSLNIFCKCFHVFPNSVLFPGQPCWCKVLNYLKDHLSILFSIRQILNSQSLWNCIYWKDQHVGSFKHIIFNNKWLHWIGWTDQWTDTRNNCKLYFILINLRTVL